MKAILTCALLVLSCPLAMAGDLAHQPRTLSKSALGPHHTKASSFAPRGHSGTHVYGSPISTPILHQRVSKPKKAGTAPTSASATHPAN
jgi:hypothetical protein